ncbi:MAG: response regulator [Bacteroidota bacterium]
METPRRPYILVVDDEPDVESLFRQKFRRKIRQTELQFFFAQNGREALEVIEREAGIGVIFTDLNMPEIDGLELLERLQNRGNRLLKSVVISAYGDMPNIRRAMNAGALDFIVKPIDLSDLETTLEKAIQEWTLGKAGQESAAALEEAERQRAITEEARRLQKEFFDNVTHEIRTPLTLLLGPLEEVMDLHERNAILRQIELARRYGQVLQDLIDELLEVARIDAGALVLNPIQADLIAFLRDLTDSFQPLARTRNIQLQFTTALVERPMDFDPRKLRRAIGNLLSNALKFTPSGGSVTLSCRPAAPDGIELEVRDTGPGIPEADLTRIFDRFFRTSSGETLLIRGTGIGLSLVQEFIQMHAGTVTATNEGGAVFSVRLPVHNHAAPGNPGTAWVSEELPDVDHRAAQSEPIASPEDRESDHLPLVLIAEDHPEMRRHIIRALGEGFRIREAQDGARAWQLAQEYIPDLVISDVMMPEMDGQELCQQLKSAATTSHIPVVLLTALAQAENRVAGLKGGADAYLSKPFRKEELQATVQGLLDSRARLKARYRDEFLLHPPDREQMSMEDQFLHRVREFMQRELANERISVEDMARELGMSRKTLHRKMKAIADVSPNQFIRRYRLEAAMEMLRNQTGPIGEVAFLTGFNSHSYFSKCFVEYFKISPSEVI